MLLFLQITEILGSIEKESKKFMIRGLSKNSPSDLISLILNCSWMAFQVTMVVDYSENYQLNEAVPSLVVRNYLRILNVPCRILLPAPSLTCPNLALTMNLSIWCCTLPHVLTLSSSLAEQSFLIAAREILSFLK
ncbi:hypothetical protein Peur_014432 [Populus x canadensis]